MKYLARLGVEVCLFAVSTCLAVQAQRTTTLTDETSNNTTGCAATDSSYVGTTSCQANFPGAKDDSSAGSDGNTNPNTVIFDAVPNNLGDFTHDGVDIHNLVYSGYNGKVFANILLWHSGSANGSFAFTPKIPDPPGLTLDSFGSHFVMGYTSDDTNQVAAQLAFMQRLNIDGIVGNPPGPLPPGTTGQVVKNANVNDAMAKWKAAADGTSGFLYSIMSDQVMWDENHQCGTGTGDDTPSCVEQVMTCSLDYMNTATSSSFTCALDGLSYAGGGFFADPHYWTVSGRPVLSYFIDEGAYFGACATKACQVYNNNQPGMTCTSSTDCWGKIFGGIQQHIASFSSPPLIIHRDVFNHAAPNNGSFRWFNPSTDQTFTDIPDGPVDVCGYACWLGNIAHELPQPPSVALGVALGKVDHAQSPFPGESGIFGHQADHLLIDAQCGQTWLAYLSAPAANFNTGNQFTALEIATWDDYDEGTEMESGIDNCVSSFTAGIAGQTASWSIAFSSSGSETTIDHYALFFSTDGTTGQALTFLSNVAVNTQNNGNYTFSLPQGLPSTTVIYVKAVGKSMITNHMVEAGVFNGSGNATHSTGSVTIGAPSQFAEHPLPGETWTMDITVNGVTDSWVLGGGGSASNVATFWADQINSDPLGQLVVATASGSTITLTSVATGSSTNYSLTAVDDFTPEGWYPLTASGSTMTGGHN